MATPSLSPSFAIAILARQAAIKAVKVELWAQGKRLSYIPPKEIRVIADQYLAAHRAELVAQAMEKWRAISSTNAKPAEFNSFGCANIRCKNDHRLRESFDRRTDTRRPTVNPSIGWR